MGAGFSNLRECLEDAEMWTDICTSIVERMSVDEPFQWAVVESGKWKKNKEDGVFVEHPKWLVEVMEEMTTEYPVIADAIYDRMHTILVEGDEP